MGQPVAGFLPLKTPRTTPPDDESMFDVSMFVERQQSLGRSVGLCINLCGGKAKAQGESSDKETGKNGKGKGALSLDRCGWCDTEGANKTCTQCRSVVYCSPACQKVSA